VIVPKCLGSEVSWVRSVSTPNAETLFCSRGKPLVILQQIYSENHVLIFIKIDRVLYKILRKKTSVSFSGQSVVLWASKHRLPCSLHRSLRRNELHFRCLYRRHTTVDPQRSPPWSASLSHTTYTRYLFIAHLSSSDALLRQAQVTSSN